MFAYCGNNPVNRANPSGYAWYDTLVNAIETVAKVVTQVAAKASVNAALEAVAKSVTGATAGSIWAAGAIGAFAGSMIPIHGVGTGTGFLLA